MREYSKEELRLLTEVLPNVAQELRGAMTNVYIAANRLAPPEARESDPSVDENAAFFLQSYYRMYRVVGNLTDAAKLAESGRFLLTNDDIVGTVREVCEKAEPLFRMKGVTLDFTSDSSSRLIAMDAALIERMLLNLLSNALKFTPKGGHVTVRVKTTPKHVLLSVSDTGRGIPPEKLERIFERFLDTEAMEPPPHGIGLGLALCRRIAEGHGGSIVAESAEGRGATFTVSLPNERTQNMRLRDRGAFAVSGFSEVLVQLSDSLPSEAFTYRYMD